MIVRAVGVALLIGVATPACSLAWPRSLPTLSGDRPPGNVACAGGGLPDAIVHGDPDSEDFVWLVADDETTGLRGAILLVRWPHGFSARFTPRLELLDGDGRSSPATAIG